jgi:phosphoribosylformylglycinamidine synthase
VAVADIGQAGGASIEVEGVLSVSLEDLRQAHETWMPAYMAGKG